MVHLTYPQLLQEADEAGGGTALGFDGAGGDAVLVPPGFDFPAQDIGGTEELALELGQGERAHAAPGMRERGVGIGLGDHPSTRVLSDSVGLETVSDLIADLEQALEAA
jgi:hypothetical protein